MQNKNDWFAQYPPLQLKEETQMAEQVEKRVLRRIAESSQPTESEVLPMKQKSKLRRIRPIIFAAAAVAVGAVSLVTANAATGGEIFSSSPSISTGRNRTMTPTWSARTVTI